MNIETLPSLLTVDDVARRERALRCTVVFHPDVGRIGAHIDLLTWPAVDMRPTIDTTLGRSAPLLSDGRGIDDPHVSRAALLFTSERGGVTVAAAGPDVKARIGPDELPRCWCSDDVLRGGVPVRLGHGVVLLLRDVALPPVGPELPVAAYPGSSVESATLRQRLAVAARTDLPVLILGESGVGKELAARAIHHHSARSRRRLVAASMASIHESLAAAELFGASRGAYTGAEARDGLFRQAHRSTLFLDEIGDASPQLQAQLLRVLQEGEVPVLGGATVTVDVRIVAATEQSIEADSGFRHALRHRLAGLTIEIAPLRQRREDIGPQVLRSLELSGADHPHAPLETLLRDPEVAAEWARVFFDLLLGQWQGNSRELDKAVIRQLLEDPGKRVYRCAETTKDGDSLTDEALEQCYTACGFEPHATAKALGLSQGTAYRRIRAHPNCRVAADISDRELDEAIEKVGDDAVALSACLRVSVRGIRRRLRERNLDNPDAAS